jgi:hypothetical protein
MIQKVLVHQQTMNFSQIQAGKIHFDDLNQSCNSKAGKATSKPTSNTSKTSSTNIFLGIILSSSSSSILVFVILVLKVLGGLALPFSPPCSIGGSSALSKRHIV